MQEKTSNSDRQQRQLAFLAEMIANFQYIAGPLNAAADAMSRLLLAEKDSARFVLSCKRKSHARMNRNCWQLSRQAKKPC